jgi:hypothetical protein
MVGFHVLFCVNISTHWISYFFKKNFSQSLISCLFFFKFQKKNNLKKPQNAERSWRIRGYVHPQVRFFMCSCLVIRGTTILTTWFSQAVDRCQINF